MPDKPTIPLFASETEEAQWWFDNQQMIADDFERAAANGTLRRGGVARRMAEQKMQGVTAIRTPELKSMTIDPDDERKARLIAERRGMDFDSCLKLLLHEAIQHELAS